MKMKSSKPEECHLAMTTNEIVTATAIADAAMSTLTAVT
jgi:hypothetical protein